MRLDSPVVDRRTARHMALGLGWFSLALGAAELAFARKLKSATGAPGPHELLQGFGAREIAAGAMILSARNPAGQVWWRVAGDALDLAALAPTLRPANPAWKGGAAAFGFVLLATAMDVFVALHDQGPEDAGSYPGYHQ